MFLMIQGEEGSLGLQAQRLLIYEKIVAEILDIPLNSASVTQKILPGESGGSSKKDNNPNLPYRSVMFSCNINCGMWMLHVRLFYSGPRNSSSTAQMWIIWKQQLKVNFWKENMVLPTLALPGCCSLVCSGLNLLPGYHSTFLKLLFLFFYWQLWGFSMLVLSFLRAWLVLK